MNGETCNGRARARVSSENENIRSPYRVSEMRALNERQNFAAASSIFRSSEKKVKSEFITKNQLLKTKMKNVKMEPLCSEA